MKVVAASTATAEAAHSELWGSSAASSWRDLSEQILSVVHHHIHFNLDNWVTQTAFCQNRPSHLLFWEIGQGSLRGWVHFLRLSYRPSRIFAKSLTISSCAPPQLNCGLLSTYADTGSRETWALSQREATLYDLLSQSISECLAWFLPICFSIKPARSAASSIRLIHRTNFSSWERAFSRNFGALPPHVGLSHLSDTSHSPKSPSVPYQLSLPSHLRGSCHQQSLDLALHFSSCSAWPGPRAA